MKEQFSKSEKNMFARAKELSEKNDILGVLEVMIDLVRINPKSAVFRAVLANAYCDVGKFELAEKEFNVAIQLAPESEKVSLGLFHCLWGQNKRVEAFEEMKRFMSIADSEDYRAIVKEINESSD